MAQDNSNTRRLPVAASHIKSRGKSLRTTILLILAIGMLVYGFALIVFVSKLNTSQLDNYCKGQVSNAFDLAVDVLDNQTQSLMEHISQMPDLTRIRSEVSAGNIRAIQSYLEYLRVESEIFAVHLVDEKANVRYSSTGQTNIGFGGLASTNLFSGLTSGAPAGGAIYADGHVSLVAVRLVAYDINSNPLYLMFEDKITTEDRINYYARLLDCQFTIAIDDMRVASSMNGNIDRNLAGEKITDQNVLDTVYKQGRPYVTLTRISGKEYATIYARYELLTGERAMLGLGMSTEEMDKITTRLVVYSNIVIIILSVIYIAVALFFFVRLVLNPLKLAGWAISNLAISEEADLTFRINNTADNEIGRLCRDIDTFLERQQDLVIDLQSAQNVLREIGSNLKLSAQDSASAITEITANIDSVRKHAENQVSSLKTTSREMSESHDLEVAFDGKIEMQTESIVESSSSIEKMVQNIESVSRSVQKMNDSFNELSDVTKNGEQRQAQVDTQVTAMSEQSKLLVEANSVISRIASQTNLLAMNAAIEAAHAGDAGAGFSVVADEIRALAETSSKQTRIINQQLQEIASTINEVVNASQLSKQAFATIIERLSQTGSIMLEIGRAMAEQDMASKQVLQALHEMNGSSAEVQAMSKNLRKSNERVIDEMGKLSHIVETVSGSMDEMNAGAQQIGKSAHNVSDMAVETDENIRMMADLVCRFKV